MTNRRDVMLTADYLKSLLHYNPDTGVFLWKLRKGSISAGEIAGSLIPAGYRVISIDNRDYYAAPLAWFYMTGAWPLYQVDHKDRNKKNNKFTNLRLATRTQNCVNRKTLTGTGIKGVYRNNSSFLASLKVNGKSIHLGSFKTIEEAAGIVQAKRIKLYGEFAGMTEYQAAREWRKRQNLTVGDLAAGIGYSIETVYWMERGLVPPKRNIKSGSTSREIKPNIWKRYKLACAGFAAQRAFNRTFEW